MALVFFWYSLFPLRLGPNHSQLAVSTRRLHDTDRSGWYNLIVLVPLFGFIVLIFFDCQDSTPGANRFGANPKVRYANSRTMD